MKNMNLICPKCGEKLIQVEKTYKCENGHSYDISKYGYINLLLNSKNSGDNKEMIKARHLFLEKGYYIPLVESICEVINKLQITNILDIGCGEGYYDRQIHKNFPAIDFFGIDISKEACLLASKYDKNITYVVSGANKLPFNNNSFELILNIFAPHNEIEFSRVSNKYILKVIPGENHLLELKQLLYKKVIIKSEKKLNFSNFIEKEVIKVSYKVCINDLYELFQMTPYFYKTKYNPVVFEENKNTLITCDFRILLYEKI